MRGIQKAVNCLNQVRVGTSLPTQGGSDGEIPNICENGASLLMQGNSFYLLRSAAKAGAPLHMQGNVRIPAPGHATVG